MAEENPEPEKRQHPLAQRPAARPADSAERQQATLFIRSVEPRATYALIAISVAVFIIRALSLEIDSEFVRLGANNSKDVIQGSEYWRLLTSMFLHAGILGVDQFGNVQYVLQNSMHLIFNMYAIYIIGRSQESFFGHGRFLAIYLLGGLGGSVLSTVLNGENVNSVGASGAVFAILGAEVVFLYQHRKLFGRRGRMRLQTLAILGVLNLLFGGLSSLGLGEVRIDNFGHIGGLIGGITLAWFIAPIFIIQPDPLRPGAFVGEDINPFGRKRWIVSAYTAGLLAILFVAGLTIHPGFNIGGSG